MPNSKLAELSEKVGFIEAVSVGTVREKEKWRQIGKDGRHHNYAFSPGPEFLSVKPNE